MKRFKSGFTLIELIVVIGIMALLYTIIFGSISDSRARARDDKRVSDIKEIQLALAQFHDGCSAYPLALSAGAVCPTGLSSAILSDFLKVIPTDPKTGLSYFYYELGNPKNFCLGAKLEIKSPSSQKDNSGCYDVYEPTCASEKCYSVKGRTI